MNNERFSLAKMYMSARTRKLRRKLVARWGVDRLRTLAEELKDVCVENWDTGPARPRLAANLLEELAQDHLNAYLSAYSHWTKGIRDLTSGNLPSSVANLKKAAEILADEGDPHESAKPAIALVTALSISGDYDNVHLVGKRAIKVFNTHSDLVNAGKIEINLSNLASRRGQHKKAEKLALRALARFVRAGSNSLASVAENGLAITYTEQYKFAEAERRFASALDRAKASSKLVTEAEIEASIGTLMLNRGDLAASLKHFELSRQKFDLLRMPHKSLVANLEIAEIYSELNLIDEAFTLYSQIVRRLVRLKMPVEEARARMGYGSLLVHMRRFRAAQKEFSKVDQVFATLGSSIGRALVTLNSARIHLYQKNFVDAKRLASFAKRTFIRTESFRHAAVADWLIGESMVQLGSVRTGIERLRASKAGAKRAANSTVQFLCEVSLGNAKLLLKDEEGAVRSYQRAIDISNSIREPLVGDEFRISVSDGKQEPYEKLAELHLSKGKLAEGFNILEAGRSQQLRELVTQVCCDAPDNEFESKIAGARERLNWDYSRLRSATGTENAKLRKKIRSQENALSSLLRRAESIRLQSAQGNSSKALDQMSDLRSRLKETDAVLYLFVSNGWYSALIISKDGIRHFERLATEQQVFDLSREFRFQIDTFRFGNESLNRWREQLKSRTDSVLSILGSLLKGPLASLAGRKRIIVIPVSEFHYLPVGAFRDEDGYLAEKFVFTHAPSASIWTTLNAAPRPKVKSSLFVGFATNTTPAVETEAKQLSAMFEGSMSLVGDNATVTNFFAGARGRDLVHIACHGDFRSDNPRYSSLFMADGRINVNDIAAIDLSGAIVTLSACETGVNRLSGGNEIVGLARGLLASGASDLILSLWNVNDTSTREFMVKFYEHLKSGIPVAEALNIAQRRCISENDHPYFWAPFFALG